MLALSDVLLFLFVLSSFSLLALDDLLLNIEISLLHAVDLKMIASTVERLQSRLRSYTSHNTLVDDSNSIAKNICLLHRVSGQHNCTLASAFGQDVPHLSSALRIESSGWFVKIDDFRIRH